MPLIVDTRPVCVGGGGIYAKNVMEKLRLRIGHENLTKSGKPLMQASAKFLGFSTHRFDFRREEELLGGRTSNWPVNGECLSSKQNRFQILISSSWFLLTVFGLCRTKILLRQPAEK